MNLESHPFSTPEYEGCWLPFTGDRMGFRSVVQSMLRERLNDAGGRLEVREDGPRWVGSVAVELSYAHSGERALLVWSHGFHVGVDLESEHRSLSQSAEKLASRFFHPSEARSVGDDSRRFLEMWCKKEAYAKLTRRGLAGTLRIALIPQPEGVMLAPAPVRPEGWIAWVAIRPRS